MSTVTTAKITWEFADKSPHWDFAININEPTSISDHIPDWVKNLKGNIKEYFDEGFGLDHTARHCLGLQGLSKIGYTCDLPIDVVSNDYNEKPWGGLNFHPYTLHGTKWSHPLPGHLADKHLHNYKWNLRLLEWPWRAKLPKGWKILMTNNMLDWSDNWYSFSGLVPHISPNANRSMKFSTPMDAEFDYCVLEQVIAIRTGEIIPKGNCIFTAIPLPPSG